MGKQVDNKIKKRFGWFHSNIFALLSKVKWWAVWALHLHSGPFRQRNVAPVCLSWCLYSKVPNKRNVTFINFRKIFQGLRSFLEGVRLSFLTKCFFQDRKVGFKIPNTMKIIIFEGGNTLIWGGYAYCFYQIFQGVRLFGGLRLLETLE